MICFWIQPHTNVCHTIFGQKKHKPRWIGAVSQLKNFMWPDWPTKSPKKSNHSLQIWQTLRFGIINKKYQEDHGFKHVKIMRMKGTLKISVQDQSNERSIWVKWRSRCKIEKKEQGGGWEHWWQSWRKCLRSLKCKTPFPPGNPHPFCHVQWTRPAIFQLHTSWGWCWSKLDTLQLLPMEGWWQSGWLPGAQIIGCYSLIATPSVSSMLPNLACPTWKFLTSLQAPKGDAIVSKNDNRNTQVPGQKKNILDPFLHGLKRPPADSY